MIEKIKEILIKNNLTLACAESCTGGLLSSFLTDISGSSAYIKQNFVTYANSAKIDLLNVSPQTIEKFGAVSEQCALEMAKGLVNKGYGDIGISTTGIADIAQESNKPSGLVFIGIYTPKKHKIIKFLAPKAGRIATKQAFAKKALEELQNFLTETF